MFPFNKCMDFKLLFVDLEKLAPGLKDIAY